MNQPLILLIETSTDICSVAISSGETLLKYNSEKGNKAHAKSIAPMVDCFMKDLGLSINDLSAIAVSEGPGSYTGLSVGVSFAKGICFASNKPLISVNSLESVAQNGYQEAKDLNLDFNYIVPMIDARRMEVYCSIYDSKMDIIEGVSAKIIDSSSFSEILANNPTIFCGNGALKIKEVLNNINAHFIDSQANAKGMIKCALNKFFSKNFEDTAYFEPFYLKDFIPGISKKSII